MLQKKFYLPILLFSLLGIFAFSSLSYAVNLSPVGSWTTISDKDGKPRSIVKITEKNNKLYGTILKIYPRPGDPKTCIHCPGRFHNKPPIGLTIMWGLHQVNRNEWTGGKILDPTSGNIYRLTLTVSPNGKIIHARGYIGISLFGRTQTWIRN